MTQIDAGADMPLDAWKIASECAGAVFALCETTYDGGSLFWFNNGVAPANVHGYGDADEPMAAFVRDNPGAPPEALWRWAAAQGFHAADAGGWDDAPFAVRAAYRLFALALPVADSLLAERAAALAPPPPPSAPPVVAPIDATILAQAAGVGDRIDAAAPLVTVAAVVADAPRAPVEPLHTSTYETRAELMETGQVDQAEMAEWLADAGFAAFWSERAAAAAGAKTVQA